MSGKFLKNVCFVKCLSAVSENDDKYCHLNMFDEWKSAADGRKLFGVPLTNLCKAFDCLLHDLLLAKLYAYRFSLSALKLINSYLKNKKTKK